MLTLRPFSRRIVAGGLCTPKGSNLCYFHYALGFTTPSLAHMLDSLVRVSRRGKENHFASITSTEWLTSASPKTGPDGTHPPRGVVYHLVNCSEIQADADPRTVTAPPPQAVGEIWQHFGTGFLRFPFSNFRYSLTLFSKFFASFPHGTCTLSVSCQYLALDGIYHPLWAAIPNNSTRWEHVLMPTILDKNGSLTLLAEPFQAT